MAIYESYIFRIFFYKTKKTRKKDNNNGDKAVKNDINCDGSNFKVMLYYNITLKLFSYIFNISLLYYTFYFIMLHKFIFYICHNIYINMLSKLLLIYIS